MNDDIRDLDSIVSEVRKSEEVSIEYMKSWELEDYIRREAANQTLESAALVYIIDMREAGVSDEVISQNLVEKMHLTRDKVPTLLMQASKEAVPI
ncbi:MAG: hypothetical protein K6F54_03900 [Lachnospiraceae bacterium]|nr:hypothetical protein [Lachnospiraceae bacterium]